MYFIEAQTFRNLERSMDCTYALYVKRLALKQLNSPIFKTILEFTATKGTYKQIKLQNIKNKLRKINFNIFLFSIMN